ncbi:MAG: tripartite tricarboxylate transporter substrate binding protein [Rhodospirillales bacterium]|nr:tripartite tricarboxylate transporter substrate binding protein [Rhodospirillales bacterium]
MTINAKSIAALAAIGFVAAAMPAMAEYPAKPIEMIIPYGAGGNTDTSGRIFINAMRKALDSEVVPLNVTGAGGTVGMAKVAAAKPDGYTLGFSPIAPVTVQPHLRPLPYGKESFEPVCLVADNPTAITVAPDSPHKTLADLIAAAKSKRVVAVGPAPGSIPHIVQSALANAYGVKFTYLPAGGGGKAAKAVIGGEADFAADTSAMEKVHGLRTLAVLSSDRLVDLPDVPTLKELGKDLTLTIWFGAFAPKGTPAEVLDKLSAACEKAVADPEFASGMAKANYIVRYMGRTEFSAFYESQFDGNQTMLSLIGFKKK